MPLEKEQKQDHQKNKRFKPKFENLNYVNILILFWKQIFKILNGTK
jgi:hypothetical protein